MEAVVHRPLVVPDTFVEHGVALFTCEMLLSGRLYLTGQSTSGYKQPC